MDMPRKRRGMMCGAVTNKNGDKKVVISGGLDT